MTLSSLDPSEKSEMSSMGGGGGNKVDKYGRLITQLLYETLFLSPPSRLQSAKFPPSVSTDDFKARFSPSDSSSDPPQLVTMNTLEPVNNNSSFNQSQSHLEIPLLDNYVELSSIEFTNQVSPE